jgi:hypothetical protein
MSVSLPEKGLSFRFWKPKELRCEGEESYHMDDGEESALQFYPWQIFSTTARKPKLKVIQGSEHVAQESGTDH